MCVGAEPWGAGGGGVAGWAAASENRVQLLWQAKVPQQDLPVQWYSNPFQFDVLVLHCLVFSSSCFQYKGVPPPVEHHGMEYQHATLNRVGSTSPQV
jgi:hypothetical protein